MIWTQIKAERNRIITEARMHFGAKRTAASLLSFFANGVIFLLVAAPVSSRPIPAAVGSGTSTAEVKAESNFTFQITVLSPKVCAGEKLSVEAELINTTGVRQVIDKQALWYKLKFSYSRFAPGRGGGGGIISISGWPELHDDADLIILDPGETVREVRTFILTRSTFKRFGKYKVAIQYGQFQDRAIDGVRFFRGVIESNEADLVISACSRRSR